MLIVNESKNKEIKDELIHGDNENWVSQKICILKTSMTYKKYFSTTVAPTSNLPLDAALNQILMKFFLKSNKERRRRSSTQGQGVSPSK